MLRNWLKICSTLPWNPSRQSREREKAGRERCVYSRLSLFSIVRRRIRDGQRRQDTRGKRRKRRQGGTTGSLFHLPPTLAHISPHRCGASPREMPRNAMQPLLGLREVAERCFSTWRWGTTVVASRTSD